MKRKIILGIISITAIISLIGCGPLKDTKPEVSTDTPANIGVSNQEGLDDIPQAVDDVPQTREESQQDKGTAPIQANEVSEDNLDEQE